MKKDRFIALGLLAASLLSPKLVMAKEFFDTDKFSLKGNTVASESNSFKETIYDTLVEMANTDFEKYKKSTVDEFLKVIDNMYELWKDEWTKETFEEQNKLLKDAFAKLELKDNDESLEENALEKEKETIKVKILYSSANKELMEEEQEIKKGGIPKIQERITVNNKNYILEKEVKLEAIKEDKTIRVSMIEEDIKNPIPKTGIGKNNINYIILTTIALMGSALAILKTKKKEQ